MGTEESAPGSVWTRPVRVPRASKGQSFTQGQVGATGVRIADADGLDAVSMRRVAGELGVTAMSLYWYVDTKDQLVELMVDHVSGERYPNLTGFAGRLDVLGRDRFDAELYIVLDGLERHLDGP